MTRIAQEIDAQNPLRIFAASKALTRDAVAAIGHKVKGTHHLFSGAFNSHGISHNEGRQALYCA